MIYKKIKGLFQCLPKESLTLEWVCRHTNESIEVVQPVLDKLVSDKIIVGKRKYKLKKVPKHVKDIPIKKCSS